LKGTYAYIPEFNQKMHMGIAFIGGSIYTQLLPCLIEDVKEKLEWLALIT
jgi:hypothetical protein